jgi:hypothetical protein
MDGKQLLSENFTEMTARISALNDKKEELKAELKLHHERIKAEIADLEKEATEIYVEYQQENSK